MKKILLRGPLLTNSGYGVHSRQVYKWLSGLKNVDLRCQLLSWGNNPWILDLDHDKGIVKSILDKSIDPKEISITKFDETYQVQLPTEWIKISNYDVGITAGIESDYCNKDIISNINKMNKVIVPSRYSKNTFLNTAKKFNKEINEINVIGESFPDLFSQKEINNIETTIKHKTGFNFLIFGQITNILPEKDRKNTVKTLNTIVKAFKDNHNVGVILKTNLGKNSKIDKKYTKKLIKSSLGNLNENRRCRIYLAHGNLNQEELISLYKSTNVLVSGTRAEGYGLTHLEASSLGIPIVSTGYSGYEDFLKENYIKVNYKMKKINFESNLFQKGLSSWAEFDEEDMIFKLKEVYKNYNYYKEKSEDYKKTIKQNYNIQSIINSYRSIARVWQMIILISFLAVMLLISLYYCIKFAFLIIKIQENLEDSINLIEEKYEKISEILEIPVFFDSPEVKKVVEDLDQARLALLYVADIMTQDFNVIKKEGSEVNLDAKNNKEK